MLREQQGEAMMVESWDVVHRNLEEEILVSEMELLTIENLCALHMEIIARANSVSQPMKVEKIFEVIRKEASLSHQNIDVQHQILSKTKQGIEKRKWWITDLCKEWLLRLNEKRWNRTLLYRIGTRKEKADALSRAQQTSLLQEKGVGV